MTGAGVIERERAPRLGETDAEAGSATGIALAGRRAFAVDIQALVVAAEGPPRRQVAGLDARRFHIVAAVVDRALGFRLIRAELFGASAGGIRLDDPGVDLAVAAALASSATGIPPPHGTGFAGELSLTGTLRPVAGMEQRISAAAAAGISRVVCPAGAPDLPRLDGAGGRRGMVEVVTAHHVRDALGWALRGGRRERSPQARSSGRSSTSLPVSVGLVS
jgi:predicted ATP-dependent serine protease